jgi:hypothetical protein
MGGSASFAADGNGVGAHQKHGHVIVGADFHRVGREQFARFVYRS